MTIARTISAGTPGWLELRRELWPAGADAAHVAEMAFICAAPERFAAFVAYGEGGAAIGVVEVSLRQDYVNGTQSSPVAFLEGVYVAAAARRRGIGRALVGAAEAWARERGCRELASDALLDNEPSHAMHRALGFTETERVVYFRKEIGL